LYLPEHNQSVPIELFLPNTWKDRVCLPDLAATLEQYNFGTFSLHFITLKFTRQSCKFIASLVGNTGDNQNRKSRAFHFMQSFT
jgi:hypothetical protein